MEPALRRELSAAAFDTLVAQWVAELRARAEVSVLGVPPGFSTRHPGQS
jgi:hypothetical protein